MKINRIPSFLIMFLFVLFGCSSPDKKNELKIYPNADNGGITLPHNFGAVVVADSLGNGRHIAVRENGDIYVHLSKLTDEGHGIIALKDTTGDGRANIKTGYSNVTGTGIEIHDGYLYYASRTEIFRSPLLPDKLIPTAQIDTLVQMVDGGGHMEKTFTFDGLGNMFVNIGSETNACQVEKRTPGSPGIDPCLELETRGGIWKFNANDLHQKQDLSQRYATGIRNAVAINWNSQVNKLYAMQHGRDDLHRFWPEYYTEEQNLELPAEEFLEIDQDDDFGWPYCHWDQFQNKKILNPEYGGNGVSTERCTGIKPPILAFPGHWAPNDLLFYQGNLFPEKYKNGAFIAFHGSWNRLGNKQQGYSVVFVPMKDGKPSGDWEIFADGFKGTDSLRNPGDARYRPCGLAEGPDGSLYIVDSQVGRVWRIMYYPEGIHETVASTTVTTENIIEEEASVKESLLPGKAVYDMYCLPCHMSNGTGAAGMNPPLTQTAWVLGEKERLIKVLLLGLNEPVEIKGEIYQNVMASHAFLTDKQISDVLTFVRQSFGNDASEVTEEEVKNVRANLD